MVAYFNLQSICASTISPLCADARNILGVHPDFQAQAAGIDSMLFTVGVSLEIVLEYRFVESQSQS